MGVLGGCAPSKKEKKHHLATLLHFSAILAVSRIISNVIISNVVISIVVVSIYHTERVGHKMHFFCSTALTSTGWVRMTIKPWHCPPSKQSGCHLISAFSKNMSGAENRTRGSWVTKRERYRCAMPPPKMNRFVGLKNNCYAFSFS